MMKGMVRGMESPFFKQFLMISDPMTVVVLVAFIVLLGVIRYCQKQGMAFGTLAILGTVLGALLGVSVQALAGFPADPTKVLFVKESVKWFSLVGGGFIDLIRMLVIPIVFVSVVRVILHMSEGANLKKLVSSTVTVSLSMVAVAAVVGLILGTTFQLGSGVALTEGAAKMRDVQSVVDTLRNLIPNNPFKAAAETNVIAIVVLAVIVGGIARLIKQTKTDELSVVTKFFDELHLVISWMADFIIGVMPYGVLALLASTLAQKGFSAIVDMGLFVVLIYVGVGIMLVVQAILLTLVGVNPMNYFAKAKEPLILAFTSRSSMGVLPLTVETLTKKLGVNPATANTVASWGTTAGMQGCAGVFPALAVVYISNISGVQFDFTMYIMSVLVIALGSVGIAGVPGTATMAASVSISGTGLGAYFASISPILAIDPIIDMGRTMLNVSGSMTNAIVVDKLMKTFDQDAYNNMAIADSTAEQK